QDLREMLDSNFRIKNVLFSDDFSSEESLQGHTVSSAAETKRSVFLTETVRNGQRIVSGADIVIAGDVNAGAELIAEGNIAVVGKLRGLAHAGANGDKSACIAATQMLSNQIRIADKIAIMPERKKTEGPELARYIGDNIVITPLS
ncbi:MAG: septum site-determining protein MinC, partial [Christensenellaceae bacterium]